MAIIPKNVLERSKNSLVYLSLFVLLLIALQGIYKGGMSLADLKAETIDLPNLPSALFLSFLRMSGAYVASLVFSLFFGVLAARSSLGERIILPILDVLQSVPVVGFFPAAISFFIGVTQGHRIGVELAAMFLIFTSMAWNLAFAVYESVRSVPTETDEAAFSFGLSGSARFLKVYAPAAIPRLAYNTILSWSNGWYFLVACEIIAVGPVQYNLPGIGSFLARAAEQENLGLVLWGLMALVAMVLLMDLFLWRPFLAWSQRFKTDQIADPNQDEEESRFLNLPKLIVQYLDFVVRPLSKIFFALTFPFRWILKEIVLPLLWDLPAAIVTGVWGKFAAPVEPWIKRSSFIRTAVAYFALGFLVVFGAVYLWKWFQGPVPRELETIPTALLWSTGRILLALAVSFMLSLPLLYFVWAKPKLRTALTTIAQMGASIPATALFPLIVLVGVKKLGGGMELATQVLLTFGIQWYVLFNVLGGSATLSADLIEATRSFGLTKFQAFRRLVFPAIRPAMITGAITAWGGGWNALVVSEYVVSNGEISKVQGLGAWVSTAVYEWGDARAIVVGIGVMVAWILVINLLIWQPLYQSNLEKFKLQG